MPQGEARGLGADRGARVAQRAGPRRRAMGGLPGRASTSHKVTLLAPPLAKPDVRCPRDLVVGYPEGSLCVRRGSDFSPTQPCRLRPALLSG